MPKADRPQKQARTPRTKLISQVSPQKSVWLQESSPQFAQGETAKILQQNLMNLIGQKYKSFEDFAHAVRIPKSTLSQIINFKRDPRLATLEQLARALGVTVAELLTKQNSHTSNH